MVQIRTDLTHSFNNATFAFSAWWIQFSQQYPAILPLLPPDILVQIQALPSDQAECQQGAEMATILADLSAGPEALIAALLYPLVEAELIDQTELKKHGANIEAILAGARKMHAVQSLRKSKKSAAHQQQVDRLRKMLIAMVNDVRVALVKLAERTYVLRHADDTLSSAAQKVLAYEVMNIYAPLANRLGIGQIKWELEDRAFRYLHREAYRDIGQKLQDKRHEREDYIADIIASLSKSLKQKNIDAEVTGRIKHIYSIWRKMQKKHLTFDQLYDIRAVRVLVKNVNSCYQALSNIQAIWPSITSEFDDYIATPKPNGYQSIHLVVEGPKDKTIEIQIRTYAMHEESEMGVAAHWRYKEGVGRDAGFEARLEWLRSLLDWQKELSQGDARIEALRTEVVDSQIYVFTPAGEVIDLPQGATPLDFAYHIHTEVGHRCRGAKVDGKMVPLTTPLQTGQRLEIITTKTGQPSRDWVRGEMGYVKTQRARQKIQHWFRQLNKSENAAEGKEILLKAIKRLPVKKVDYPQIAKAFNVHDPEDLYAAIATGDTRLQQVVNYITTHFSITASSKPTEALEPAIPSITPKATQSVRHASDLVINGVDNLLFHMAGCCRPIFGDDVVGYITQGRGVTVHREDCQNICALNASRAKRIVEVKWGNKQLAAFVADLTILVEAQPAVRTLTQFIANEDVQLMGLTTRVIASRQQVSIRLSVQVKDRESLNNLQNKIRQLPGVLQINR